MTVFYEWVLAIFENNAVMAEGRQRRSARISGLNAGKPLGFARDRDTRGVPQGRKGQVLSGRADGGQHAGVGLGLPGRKRGRKKKRLRAVVEVVVNSVEKEAHVDVTEEEQNPKQDDQLHNPDELSRFPSSNWMPRKGLLELVLDILQKKDTHDIFSQPVDPEEVEGYYDIIKDPMDFGTMRAKLHEGMYTTLEEFESDVFLISSNAMHFNSSSTIFFRQARAIQELAKKTFHALKTDPGNFELENSALKKKSGTFIKRVSRNRGNGSHVESRGQDFGSHAVLATNMRRRNLVSGVAAGLANGRLGSSYVHSSLPRNAQAYPVPCDSSPLLDGRRDYDEDFSSLKDGRRFSFSTEERRATYRPWNSFIGECDSIILTHYKNPQQLLNIDNQSQFGYAESLARFAANLGPTAQMVAKRKLQRCQIPSTSADLACDGVAFRASRILLDNIPSQPTACSDNTSRTKFCGISDNHLNFTGEMGKDQSTRTQPDSYFSANQIQNFDPQAGITRSGMYISSSRTENSDPQITRTSSIPQLDSCGEYATRENYVMPSYRVPPRESMSEVSQSRLLEIVSRSNNSASSSWLPRNFHGDGIRPDFGCPLTREGCSDAERIPFWPSQDIGTSSPSGDFDPMQGLAAENGDHVALWAPSGGIGSVHSTPCTTRSQSQSELLASPSSQQPRVIDMSWVQSRLGDMSSHGRNGFLQPESVARLQAKPSSHDQHPDLALQLQL